MKQVSFLGLANPTGEPGKEKFHWLDGMVSRYDAWASGSGSVNMVAAKMHSNGQWYASKDTASFAYCSISGTTLLLSQIRPHYRGSLFSIKE